MATLALPLADTGRLRQRVEALAENRPAVYRMLDFSGQVLYVGKAGRLRTRLLSYFRATYPEEKAARILAATADIRWSYKPSEFAALLDELRLIHRLHPPFNVHLNRHRRVAFIKIYGGAAPKIAIGRPGKGEVAHYGPFTATARLKESLRVLNDLMGLRDCALDMPIAFREQCDLFAPASRAGCLRYDLGTCTAPCGGFVSEEEYRTRVQTATAFLEARGIAPLDRVVDEMTRASKSQDFERAAWWRTRFEALTWLMSACVRAHSALDTLTFVYHVPGAFGDDRSYLIRRAAVLAEAPTPRTPIEREAFRGLLAQHLGNGADLGPLPPDAIDEALLLLQWFRRHPGAINRTAPLSDWAASEQPASCQPA